MAFYCRSVRRRIIASRSLQQAIILILLSVFLTVLCLKLYYGNTLDQDKHLDRLKAHVSGHDYMRSHTDGDPAAEVHRSSLTHTQQKHRGEKTLNVIVVDEHHEGGEIATMNV